MSDRKDRSLRSPYIKKKVIMNRHNNSLTIDDDLSLQSTPIDVIIEEKTCTANESESAPQEDKKPQNLNESTIERFRSFGEGEQFRAIIKGLMKKRTDKTYNRGRFKPDLYHRDFLSYFNFHKFIIMLRRNSYRENIYPKATSGNLLRNSTGTGMFNDKSFGETTIDHYNTISSNINNLSLSLNPKKSSSQSPNVSKVLTKIPNKLSGENKRLDYAYTKAKDAARVVRRLEYSYNMKINTKYSKPYHKTNAQLIQKWWRKTFKEKTQTPPCIVIQKTFKGRLTRIAFKETLRFIQYLPFLSLLHSKFFDKLNQAAFDDLLFKFGMRTLNSIIIPKADLLVRKVKSYLTNRVPVLPKAYQMKCSFHKHIFDCRSSHGFNKLQGRIKLFLMKNNNRIMLCYAAKVHPYLYYYLRYGTQRYRKKVVSFRRCYLRLREFNLQVNKGLENRFELLPFLLRKMYWKSFKQFNDEAKKRDNNLPIKKRLMRKHLKYNDRNNLRNALGHWVLYNKVHKRFITPHNSLLLKMLCKSLQGRVNMRFFEFMSKIKAFTYNRKTKREAIRGMFELKAKLSLNPIVYANKYFQIWRKTSALVLLRKSSKKLNRFLSSTKTKYKQSKAIKHFYMKSLVQTAAFYKKASSIDMKIKKNVLRYVLTKIRSIGSKQKMQALLRSMIHPGKARFIQWVFQNRKYKHAIKAYFAFLKKRIQGKNRQLKLLSIKSKLQMRLLHHHLRKAFLKYRIHSEAYYRYQHCFNLQLLFFNKKKKQISKLRYRLLRYTVNRITQKQNDFKLNQKFIEKWDAWVRLISAFKLRKFLKRGIKRLTAFKLLLKRYKIMHWKKLNKLRSKSKSKA